MQGRDAFYKGTFDQILFIYQLPNISLSYHEIYKYRLRSFGINIFRYQIFHKITQWDLIIRFL